MKLIKPSFEIWEQESGREGIYKQIERCGRTCYKSADKITEDSAKPFVERMIASKHYAMLEHGTVYLRITEKDLEELSGDRFLEYLKLTTSQYSRCKDDGSTSDNDAEYITTNLRFIVENNLGYFLRYLSPCTKYHEKRITVHFICNRQVSHEFVRHKILCVA